MDLSNLVHQLFHEPDLDKRRYIPDKLAKLGDWQSTEPLGKIVTDRTQPTILRNEAVESLGKQGDPKAIPFLAHALEDTDPEIRRTAIWSLGQIGTPECLDPIWSCHNDSSIPVRRWVAKSLGRIRSSATLTSLEKLYTQESETIIKAEILRSINSQIQKYSADLDKWHGICQTILTEATDKILRQAAAKLLFSLYQKGVSPDHSFLLSQFNNLTSNDFLIRPYLLYSLGLAKEIEFLHQLNDNDAILALGYAEDIDYLEEHLLSSDPLPFLKALSVTQKGNPNISKFLDHDDLNIRLAALEIHAKRKWDITIIHKFYKEGKGTNKILELYKYYGAPALEIYKYSAFDTSKVIRQTTISSLISPYMIANPNLSKAISQILTKVAKNDRIWHIRRDARIGLELLGDKME